MNAWTFGRKLALGFGAAAVVLGVVAFAGYRTTHNLIESDEWVAHTYQVRRDIGELMSLMKDAESGQRGFVITADDLFLEPYARAIPLLGQTFEELRKLTSDNPAQQRNLDALKPILDAKVAMMKKTIDLRRGGEFVPVAKIIGGGEGKRLMDEVRRIGGEMDRTEFDLLERRRVDSEGSAAVAKAAIVWGSLIGMALVALIGALIARGLTQQIGSAVRHIRSSSTELQAAANQQATGAKEQATAMNEITTTISELLATSRQIAESAQRVSQIAGQTASTARLGNGTVDRATESIAGIRRQVDAVVAHMLELGKKSQQIGAVLDIVGELSEQTNILAINATIEAAGAGEAGKRFAVVAEEIRELADRVSGSTKEIRGLIDDVRSAVNTTVMVTETSAKAVEAGNRQFSEVAAQFKDINGSVETASSAAREIELSTKQQATAVEQVNLAISNVAQSTRETETSSGQTLQTASQLASLSRELLSIVEPGA